MNTLHFRTSHINRSRITNCNSTSFSNSSCTTCRRKAIHHLTTTFAKKTTCWQYANLIALSAKHIGRFSYSGEDTQVFCTLPPLFKLICMGVGPKGPTFLEKHHKLKSQSEKIMKKSVFFAKVLERGCMPLCSPYKVI